MASNLPDMKQKQKLLYAQDISSDVLVKHGTAFFEEGWLSDAIDFFAKAEHTEGVEQVKRVAVEEGDAFLFKRCLDLLGIEDASSQWCELADRALALGKLQFAREGYRKCGDRKAMEKVDKMISPHSTEEQPENGFKKEGDS